MKQLVAGVGYFRVAAVLIGCALALEILRTQAFALGSFGRVACTWGEIESHSSRRQRCRSSPGVRGRKRS